MNITSVKNVVVSGTNFWNPGDDFVRDGVICILRELFRGYSLNFLFYNFNQDFFPHDKFDGISNTVAKGDLDLYRNHVDMIVIAGLSAGNEIKDLYHWILANNLQDRVYLIGAGYENSYVAENILQEPEASIFKSARVITGRTRKKPAFIDKHNLPYHYINCPAILSVPSEKAVPNGKRIEKIGFSIQLPHEAGVPNHCCAKPIFDLAVSTLFDLSKKYQVEVIAHHKSEYFFFLKALQTHGIPVRFSSFYQEYHDIYRSYDLMITTRLHASLYANGHGIPGIIVNDTDRHTHCLEGFPHSVWVNSRETLYCALDAFNISDLASISTEAGHFKRGLLQKYLSILKEPFGLSSSNQENQGYLRGLVLQSLAQVENKIRVLSLLQLLTPDRYLEGNIQYYKDSMIRCEGWFDNVVVLNWFAHNFFPSYYLEIGVRRGRSLVQVMSASPLTRCYGFDMWLQGYSGEANPGPDFVLAELRKAGVLSEPVLIVGDSHVTVPQFFDNPVNPQQFELILVDGDHSYQGAKADLAVAFNHLAPGGLLVFDDIRHTSHPELAQLWQEIRNGFPEYLFIEDTSGNGTGCCFKPPFDRLLQKLSGSLTNSSSI